MKNTTRKQNEMYIIKRRPERYFPSKSWTCLCKGMSELSYVWIKTGTPRTIAFPTKKAAQKTIEAIQSIFPSYEFRVAPL